MWQLIPRDASPIRHGSRKLWYLSGAVLLGALLLLKFSEIFYHDEALNTVKEGVSYAPSALIKNLPTSIVADSALGQAVSGTGNDHFEPETSAPVPRAWKEFLDSGGNSAYLTSLDPEEISACSDCVFAFRTAVQSRQLSSASVLIMIHQMAESPSVNTATTVLGLAKAWDGQPLGPEATALAESVIDRYSSSPQGLDAIAKQAAADSLTDIIATRLANVFSLNEHYTRSVLTDPVRPETTIDLVARLAPINTVCQAIQESDSRRAATLRGIISAEHGNACF